jgi:streptogramin lyase
MENLYLSLNAPSAFKKLPQLLAMTLLLLVVANGSVSAQTPAITYPSAKTFAAGMPISAFGPTSSSDVSPLSYSSSNVIATPSGAGPNGVALDAAGNIFFSASQDVYMQPAGSSSLTNVCGRW